MTSVPMPAEEACCPVCQSRAIFHFFESNHIPAQDGVVWPSREAALKAPVGTISLVFCQHCHTIYNQSFQPEKITFENYDFSLHYSPTYQAFNDRIIAQLIGHHDLHQKTILGVACGRGHFLVQLCRSGQNKGIGIDPSFEPTEDLAYDPGQIAFFTDYYGPKFQDLRVDFITCRHLLDELPDPVAFLKQFRHNLKGNDRGGIYLEVPNALKTFQQQLIWNIGYAKHTWYTPQSIAYQLRLAGFAVSCLGEYLSGDYLGVEAIPSSMIERPENRSPDETLSVLKAFNRVYREGLEKWRRQFEYWGEQDRKVALWGAGMRGINFLNAFPRHDIVSSVIDINPHRRGKFLPVSAFQVQAPEVLTEKPVDVIIISNATYQEEIRQQARSLGFAGEFEVF